MRTWKKYFNEFLIDDIANGNVYVMVREYPKYYPEILRIFIPSSAKVYNAKDFIIQSIKNGSIKDCIEAIKHFRGETKVKENADGSFITIKFLHKDSLRRIYQNPNRKYKINKVNPYRHCSRPRIDWEKIIRKELAKDPF